MKISVVTPAFNASSTILSNIRSVLDQSHDDWEHVIVDDGSMDDTARLASSIDDARVRVLRGAHGGVCAARNRGVAEANGEVVTFLDADDVADRDWLATFADAFDRRPDLGLVCCGARVVADGVAERGDAPCERRGPAAWSPLPVPVGHVRAAPLAAAPSWALRRAAQARREHRSRLPRRRRADDVRNVICLRRSTVDHVEPRPPADGPARPGPARECRAHARQVRRPSSRRCPRRAAASNGSLRSTQRGSATYGERAGTQHERCGCGRTRRQAGPRPWAASCLASTGVGAGPRRGPRLDRPCTGDHRVATRGSPCCCRSSTAASGSGGRSTASSARHSPISSSSSSTTARPTRRPRSCRPEPPTRACGSYGTRRTAGSWTSLNHGLSLCRGELIARLDADDWAFPTRLARQVAEFDARPELVLCASPYERRRPAAADSSERGTSTDPRRVGDCDAPRQSRAPLHDDVPARCGVAVGGYDPAWFPVEDYDLWLRLLDVGEFHALATAEVAYTVNPRASRHDSRPTRASRLLVGRSVPRGSRRRAHRMTGRPARIAAVERAERRTRVATRSVGASERRGIAARRSRPTGAPRCQRVLRDRTRLRRALTISHMPGSRSSVGSIRGCIGDQAGPRPGPPGELRVT